jgi:hypothetical protein
VLLEGVEDVGRGHRGDVVRAHRQVDRCDHLRGGSPEIVGGAAEPGRHELVDPPFPVRGGIAGGQGAHVDLQVLRQAGGHRGQRGRHRRALREAPPARRLLLHRLLLPFRSDLPAR